MQVNDHPTKPGTVFETRDVYSIATLFPVRIVKQFWQCAEKGDTLTCEPICGLNQEVGCLSGAVNDKRFQR
jgi:hypothetical protein